MGGSVVEVRVGDWKLKGNCDIILVNSRGKKESSGGKKDGNCKPGCVGVVGSVGLVLFADVMVRICRT